MKPVVLELVQSMEKGGRTKRIVETATGLARKGWRVKVLSMTEVAPWVKETFSEVDQWLQLSRKPKLDLIYVLRLASLIRKEHISLIHAHCEASYFYGGLAGKLTGVPVVGTYHRSDLRYFEETWRLRFFAKLLTRAVAISNERMALMATRLGIQTDKTVLIHGGLNLDTFATVSADRARQLQEEQGLQERRVLLSVGHLGPIKGHETTLQALPDILKAHPDIMLIIAGDGAKEDYQRLNQLISKLGLKDHVRLLGQTHNVTEWLALCELFVQPSIEEGFGLVFVEAGASARAVVATSVGGIKDIVIDHKTGLLVSPGNVEELSAAIQSLLGDPATAAAYGAAGYERAHACFSLERMTEKYDNLFSSLVPQKNSASAGQSL